MAIGIGEAIGLQNTTRQQGDPLQWIKLAGAEKRQERAAKKAAEKELVSAMDFKVPWDKGILPAWGKAIAEEKARLYNNYAKYMQEDQVTAQSRIYADIEAAKQRVSGLLISNDNAREYVKLDKATNNVDEEIQQTLQSPNADFNVIGQLVQKKGRTPFINIDETGAFSYQQIPKFDYGKEAKLVYDTKKAVPGSIRPTGLAGQFTQDVIETSSDVAIGSEAARIASLSIAEADYQWNNPGAAALKQSDPVGYQTTFIDHITGKIKPLVIPRTTQQNLTERASSGSGGSSPKVESPIQYNTKVTVNKYKQDEKGLAIPKTDKKGNVIKGEYEVTGTTEMDIPISVDIQNSKPVTLDLNNKMIDAETNLYIKKAGQINFKPDGIQYFRLSNGEYKAYVTGVVVKNVDEDGEEVQTSSVKEKEAPPAEKRETIYRVKVPLDESGVRSMIEGLNPREMKSWDAAVDKFNRERKSGGAKASSKSTYSIKGTNYTEQQLLDMGYTPEQIAPYKK